MTNKLITRAFLFFHPDWEVDIDEWDCGCCAPIPGTSQPTCRRGEDCCYFEEAEADGTIDEWELEKLDEAAIRWWNVDVKDGILSLLRRPWRAKIHSNQVIWKRYTYPCRLTLPHNPRVHRWLWFCW